MSASIVSEWAKDFDINAIVEQERMDVVEKLEAKDDTASYVNLASSAVAGDMAYTNSFDVDLSAPTYGSAMDNAQDSEDSEDNDEMKDESEDEVVDAQQSGHLDNIRTSNFDSKRQKRQKILNWADEEDQFNPQHNQQLKKSRRANKKKKKKVLLARLAAAQEDNDNYNFSTDYLAVKKAAMEEEEPQSNTNDQEDDEQDEGDFQFDV